MLEQEGPLHEGIGLSMLESDYDSEDGSGSKGHNVFEGANEVGG